MRHQNELDELDEHAKNDKFMVQALEDTKKDELDELVPKYFARGARILPNLGAMRA